MPIEIKELGGSEIEINTEIAPDIFESYRTKAIAKFSQSVEISGFRRGHIPENILVQKVGEDQILQEMAESAIADFYPKFLKEKKIDAVGRPHITITKIARGNPLGFKIKTAVMPEINLPDYKSIAQNVFQKAPDEKFEVSDKEVEDAIIEIRKNWAQTRKKESLEYPQHSDGGKNRRKPVYKNLQGLPERERSQSGPALENVDLPLLTDEFVGKLGKFETVEDFKKKIQENLEEEKRLKAKEKKRIQILDEIIKQIRLVLPLILIESEQGKMMAEFKGNIEGLGMNLEDYFIRINKSEADLKKEWLPEAEKRVKIQYILSKIAEVENLSVPENELKKETDRLIEYHKGQKIDPLRARAYIENVLLNERAFKFLEEQRKSKNT